MAVPVDAQLAPHLPVTVRAARARQLAWLKWTWKTAQDEAYMAAIAGTITVAGIAGDAPWGRAVRS
jgi:hypothetical protein